MFLATILVRRPCEITVQAARAVWINQEIADEKASKASLVLAHASRVNLRIYNGKSPKCILGGLFYILGFSFCAPKTQREIADFLCTTEVSVRRSYNSWLSEFPRFFTDATVKI
jgi:transcription initiation factor TFIIIB Brf1 subunit/transcription initiation factor TFIIB